MSQPDSGARLGKCTAIGIETAVRFPMSVLMNKSAWAVFGVAWLVCVALIWIFLLDFDCKQLEISYKCRIYARSTLFDL